MGVVKVMGAFCPYAKGLKIDFNSKNVLIESKIVANVKSPKTEVLIVNKSLCSRALPEKLVVAQLFKIFFPPCTEPDFSLP
jgi:hypothetical protein